MKCKQVAVILRRRPSPFAQLARLIELHGKNAKVKDVIRRQART
jgi:hypothetical protein